MPNHSAIDNHVKKKKGKPENDSEHCDIEEPERRKKKNKHKRADEETFMDVNISDCNSNTERSAKKKKKKKRKLEESVEETAGETDHPEEESLNQSVRKKKPRRSDTRGSDDEKDYSNRRLNKKMSADEVLNRIPKRDADLLEENFPKIRSLSGKGAKDLIANELSRIKEAKAKANDSEHCDIEEPERRKKKNKHKRADETFTDVNISDCNSNTERSAKKKKKKKKLEESVEETAGETDHPEEESLNQSVRKKKHRRSDTRGSDDEKDYSNRRLNKKMMSADEVLNTIRKRDADLLEENFPKIRSLSGNAVRDLIANELSRIKEAKAKANDSEHCDIEEPEKRKKKNKHKRADETFMGVSISDYNSNLERSAKKKKKKRKLEESVEETAGETDHPEEESLNQSVRKKKRRRSDTRGSDDENDNGEKSVKKKKKCNFFLKTDSTTHNSSLSKEPGAEHSGHSKCFTKDTNPEPSDQDDAEPEQSGEEEGERTLEVSLEETLDRTAEGTDIETNKDDETREKTNEENREVTAESERLEDDQMQSPVHAKRAYSNRRPYKKMSADEVLNRIRKRDADLLEEYFPQIRSLNGNSARDLIAKELSRIKEAKAKGIVFERGKFDSTEDDIIRKNVEDFQNLLGLESTEILFHTYRFPEVKSLIRNLKTKYHFYHRIAQGVPRSVNEVFTRGISLFDISGNKGRFSKEEVETLQRGIKEHGNNWHLLANMINRCCDRTRLKASQMRRELAGGKWSIEEVNRLIDNVKEFIISSLKKKKGPGYEPTTVPKKMLYSGIPWVKIEEAVKTRNWTNCKSKWYKVILFRMNGGRRPLKGALGTHLTIKMIKWLHEAKISKGRVNWLSMAACIGNVPPGVLQEKLYALKSQNIPDWQKKSFEEIVDYLYESYLPTLEDKLDSEADMSDLIPKIKEEFLITDIFREYTEDEITRRKR